MLKARLYGRPGDQQLQDSVQSQGWAWTRTMRQAIRGHLSDKVPATLPVWKLKRRERYAPDAAWGGQTV